MPGKGSSMKRFPHFRLRRSRITGIFLLVCAFCPFSALTAQQSETAASLGLGTSRFDSGYSPIVISHTTIVPGTPFNVKPTMDNLISTSKTSMGGILTRFNTSNFGQIFNGPAIPAAPAATSAIARKAPPPPAPPAVVPGNQPYPPRLVLDEDFPQTRESVDFDTREKIEQITKEILARNNDLYSTCRVGFDYEGRTVTLRGNVDSAYVADLIALAVEMEPGIDRVVNELAVPDEELSEP